MATAQISASGYLFFVIAPLANTVATGILCAMLYERDAELQCLADLVDKASSGSGFVVALSGEAGVGKSSLLSEFANRLPDNIACHWGMCDPLYTPRPLGPVQDIADMLVNVDADQKQPNTGGLELFGTILASLKRSSEPSVLLIEDVHWADVGTLDFIRFLGRRIGHCNAVLVVSFRDDEVDPKHALRRVLGDLPADRLHRITLGPLSLEAVRQMAAGTDRDVEELLRVTGGNPFFVTEIVSAKGVDKARVPDSVQDAVSTRLARLDKQLQDFLEALSVVPVSIEQSKHGIWIDDRERLFEAALSTGTLILNPEGGLRFRHELARLATSQRCSAHEIRRLHQRHLDNMLSHPDVYSAGEIVHHAKGAVDASAVLRYAPLAGEEAARLGAHAEAAAYYETALEFVDEAEPQLAAELYDQWAYEAGLSLRIDDRVVDARRHALTLWRAIGRTDRVAENLRRLSRMHWYRGEAAQAGRHLDESIALFEQLGDEKKLAMAYSMRSQMMMLASRMEEAIEWGTRAIRKAEPDVPAEIEAHALNNIGTARLFLGQEQGLADLQRSLDLSLSNHLHEDAARAFTNLSEYAVDLGHLDLAEKALADGIAFDIEHDLDNWTHYLRGRLAQLRIEQGRLTEAVEIAEQVLARPDQTMLMQLPARIMLGRAKLRLGHPDAAKALESSRGDAMKTGEVQYLVPIQLTLLERSWLTGDSEIASNARETLSRIGHDLLSRGGNAELAFWTHLTGNDDEALHGGLPEPIQLVLNGRMEEAGNRLEASGNFYVAALCHALGDSPDVVSEALARLRRMGATPAVDRLVELAEMRGISRFDLRIPRGPYHAARSNSFGLTAKEQTVLALMVEGLGNAEIADRLSRSQRTVEHHVSSILRKLEAETRIAAVVKTQQDPELRSLTKLKSS